MAAAAICSSVSNRQGSVKPMRAASRRNTSLSDFDSPTGAIAGWFTSQ